MGRNKVKRGYWKSELEDLAKQDWFTVDKNLRAVLDGESNCTHWAYGFYAVDKDGKFVVGFDDEDACDEYCAANKYLKLNFGQVCHMANRPTTYKNWATTYPDKGLRND